MNTRKTLELALLFNLAAAVPATAAEIAARPDPGFPREKLKMANVTGVAIDRDGRTCVAGGLTDPVLVFDAAGNLVAHWGQRDIVNKHGLRIYGDAVWVTDIGGHRILKYDRRGKLLFAAGEKGVPGCDERHFNAPTDVAVAPDGNIYVSDGYGNSRIVCLGPDGGFRFAWGKKGTAPGEFNMPHNLLIGPDGNLYVADRGNDRIQVFTPDGRFLTAWTGLGRPFGLGWAPDGTMLVTVVGKDRDELLRVDLHGAVLERLGRRGTAPGEFKTPHSVAAVPGVLVVGEAGNQRIQRFQHTIPNVNSR